MGLQAGTAARGSTSSGGVGPRPLTSIKGAGFVGGPARADARGAGPAPPLVEKGEPTPLDAVKEGSRRVHALLEASAEAAGRGDAVLALERAKEAGRKERALGKAREAAGMAETEGTELTYAVLFNLATAYTASKQWNEALSTYTLLAKNKALNAGPRVRINMGNLQFEQGLYPGAIKQYRMALDTLPAGARETRVRVQRNIGHAFVKQGAYSEAISAYEAVMDAAPDVQAGFDLLLCFYALGEPERMRYAFSRLLSVPLPLGESEDGEAEGKADEGHGKDDGASALLSDLELSRDALREELAGRQRTALAYVRTAATLIAPVLDPSSWVAGYDWCISQLSVDHPSVASEMAIARALGHLARKHFSTAVEELKAFGQKGVALQARASVNLSFIYFLEGDLAQAGKYAALAVKTDRYNARALVNMGNCLWEDRGDVERAKELYLEAIGVEADCSEAIYNLGLVNKRTGALGEALLAFEKLHTLVPSSPEVLYQLASLHEALGARDTALKFLKYLAGRVPNDPGVLARLGAMYARRGAAGEGAAGEGGDGEAFHYHAESYRVWPGDLEVLSWLGVWYVKAELYEKAVEFFERAAEVQPDEPKWKLMTASCLRRAGAAARSLEVYEEVAAAHPDNIECLRSLVSLCKETRRRADAYEAALARLERAAGMALSGDEGGRGGAAAPFMDGGDGYGGGGGAHDTATFAAPAQSGLVRAAPAPEDEWGDADVDALLM